jgi:hypothetical protein
MTDRSGGHRSARSAAEEDREEAAEVSPARSLTEWGEGPLNSKRFRRSKARRPLEAAGRRARGRKGCQRPKGLQRTRNLGVPDGLWPERTDAKVSVKA